MKQFFLLIAFLAFVGCSNLNPDLIKALAQDNASFCAASDIRGGAGSLMSPMGGYGQSELRFCRSNQPNAKVTLDAAGNLSIEHGAALGE